MDKKSIELLKIIMETPSPSGYESMLQRVIKREMEKIADEVRVDVMGNVMGILHKGGKPRVMLAGHCDEIGLMVKFITPEGYIHFVPIGGVDAHLLPGKRVYIWHGENKIPGIIGRKPIHILEEEERKKVSKIEDMFIDIGAKDKKEAESRVSVGDPVTFQDDFSILHDELAVARGFDDRLGAFIILEVLKTLKGKKFSPEVCGVSTVQEEVGLRGARTSAFSLHPDIGICIEVAFASDFPGIDKKKVGDVGLGKGPVISRGPNLNPLLVDKTLEIARKEGIPVQISGEPRGTPTDANVIQLTREGVATLLISVPLRYMHTPSEVISLRDVEDTVRLIASLLQNIYPEDSFVPV